MAKQSTEHVTYPPTGAEQIHGRTGQAFSELTEPGPAVWLLNADDKRLPRQAARKIGDVCPETDAEYVIGIDADRCLYGWFQIDRRCRDTPSVRVRYDGSH